MSRHFAIIKCFYGSFLCYFILFYFGKEPTRTYFLPVIVHVQNICVFYISKIHFRYFVVKF